MRIDVHAHYWAQSYIDLLVAAGRTDVVHAGQRDDLDARLAEMDSVGVDVQLFSAIGLNTEIEDVDQAVAAARHINELYGEISERYAGRFRGFASLPLPHAAASVAEADRALSRAGIVGIALPCIVAGRPIDEFAELWDYLGGRDGTTVIYIHPVGSDSNCHPGLAQFGLNMLLGSSTQIAMAPLRMALTGITSRYPNLRFVYALCGGTLPYLWDRYERNLRRGLDQSAVAAVGREMFRWMDALPFDRADPMALIRHNAYFDTSVQDVPAGIGLTKRAVGVERMLLGSDAIFANLTEAVRTIENSADLDADEKTRILDENASALLGLRQAGGAPGAPRPLD